MIIKWKRFAFVLAALLLLVSLTACTDTQSGSKPYAFTVNGVTITADAEVAPIVKALGEPLQYDESPSCAFEGLDKIYTYAGFDIQTYQKEGVDYVYCVYFTDDTVATAEGIAIGSTLAAVDAAYGDAYTPYQTGRQYVRGGMALDIFFKNDTVSQIWYRSNYESSDR